MKNLKKSMPDWTKLSQDDFFILNEKYYISFDSNFVTPEEISTKMEKSKLEALSFLLEKLNKNFSIVNLKTDGVEAQEYFIVLRPDFGCNNNLKILVSVPKSLVSSFSEKEKTTNSTKTVFLEINLNSFSLEEDVAYIIKKFDSAAEEVSVLKDIVPFNLIEEGKKIKLFFSNLKSFLLANNIIFKNTNSDLIIVGVDRLFNLLYIDIDQGNGVISLEKDLESFKKAVERKTLFFINKVLNIQSGNVSVTELLTGSADFTLPDINVNEIGKNIPSTAKNVDQLIKKFNFKSTKTEAEKDEEEELLNSPELKEVIYNANKVKTDFVGDEIFFNFENLLEEINSLEDVYSGVLNKVGLKGILNGAKRCIVAQLPLDDVNAILNKAKLLALDANNLIGIAKSIFNLDITRLDFLKPLLLAEIRKYLEGLAPKELKFILDKLGNSSGTTSFSLDDLENINFNLLFSLLEKNGERIMLSVVEQNKQLIFSQLETTTGISL